MKRVIVLSMALGLIMGSALAAVPQNISYQGVLTNGSGGIVPNGNYNLTLSLYDTLSGGTALWSEGQLVSVNNGIFNVMLGAVTPIHIAFDKPLFLGVAVAGGSELAPRTLLTATPYSLNAPVMRFGYSDATTDLVSTGWTNYEDDTLTINCPGPGYLVVQSEVWLIVSHTSGEELEVYIVHDTTATGPGPEYDMRTPYELQSNSAAVAGNDVSVPVQTIIPIPSAGPRSVYLNGMKSIGTSNVDFYYASTVATWYPASNPVVTLASAAIRPPKLEPKPVK